MKERSLEKESCILRSWWSYWVDVKEGGSLGEESEESEEGSSKDEEESFEASWLDLLRRVMGVLGFWPGFAYAAFVSENSTARSSRDIIAWCIGASR